MSYNNNRHLVPYGSSGTGNMHNQLSQMATQTAKGYAHQPNTQVRSTQTTTYHNGAYTQSERLTVKGAESRMNYYTSKTFKDNGQTYEKSYLQRSGPRGSGLRENCTAISNSSTGYEKMRVGRMMDGRGHFVQQTTDKSGRQTQTDKFINMDANDAGQFHRNWKQNAENLARRAITR